jgi:hypothetical protein
MPFIIPPNPKQLRKINIANGEVVAKKIPERWEDFVKICTIRSGSRMVKFEAYDYQIQLSNLMDQYSNITIVKSRQLGITQAVMAKFLHQACLNPAFSAMIFLKTQRDSSNLARRAREMLASLYEYVENESDNLTYMKIKNGGQIFFNNSASDSGRGYDSVNAFLFDEAAFSPNIENIYASASSASALVGDAVTNVVISTPSSKFGWFWDRLNSNNGDVNLESVCQKVVDDELQPFHYWEDTNGDCKAIIHWKAHPIYSQKDNYLEYRQKQDGTSWDVIHREYNLMFVDNEVSVFNSDLVRKNATINFDIEVVKNAKYFIGIDTANMGNDYTVAIVLKQVGDEFHLIDIYRDRKKTSDYDILRISDLISKYSPQKVAIEVTGGTGLLYLEQLSQQHRGVGFESIKTTKDSKPTMIDRLILALEKGLLKFPIVSALTEELLTYRRQGNRLEASSGKHDDCVMAVAFALSVSPFTIKKVPLSFCSIRM